MANSRPQVTEAMLIADMKEMYDLTVSEIKELQSYDDAMFLVTTNGKEKYIAKYYNPLFTTPSVLSKILEVLVHLRKFNVPRPVQQLSGNMFSTIKDMSGENEKDLGYLVVFRFIPGKSLACDKKEPSFWRKLGRMVAEMSEAMSEIKCDDYDRYHLWDMLIADKTLEEYKKHFPSEKLTCVNVDSVIQSLKEIKNDLKDFPKQLVHHDVNEYNIIIGDDGEIGIIDLNDTVRSYRVFDLGHCIAYMIEAQHCDLMVGRFIFEGYSSVIEPSEKELRMLYDIAIARFTLSITIGCENIHSGAANEYVEKCVADNTAFLKTLSNVGRETFNDVILGSSLSPTGA